MAKDEATHPKSDRRLIEDWLPMAELSEESRRERRSMTALPATYYLHVWFARRPLVASRAAILASLLPAEADRDKYLHTLGIHGDPMASRLKILEAKQSGERFAGEAYTYSRAFTHLPGPHEIAAFEGLTLLDPTAGGGSIPFESVRCGLNTIGNDLNPVAVLVQKATIEFPENFGTPLLTRFKVLAQKYVLRRDQKLREVFPLESTEDREATNWIWARTITCPYCQGIIPLSPNWRLNPDGIGVRLLPICDLTHPEGRHVQFEIVQQTHLHSPGTVAGGDALCPFPDCKSTVDGDEIKRQAQAGKMGHQLYTVVYKETRIKGHTKASKPKLEKVRGYRAPRPEDNIDKLIQQKLAEKLPGWQARNIIPDEAYPSNTNDPRPIYYGSPLWRDLFSPRQLYGHCTSVEVFHDLVAELNDAGGGSLPEIDKAALAYLCLALDKMLNYNSLMSVWMSTREVVANTFNRHDFAFCSSYAEMAPTITGLGYDWAIEQTGKSLSELIDLLGQSDEKTLFSAPRSKPSIRILNESADALSLPDACVDCIVMDPPYYDNVMYAELSDYFYVWLKRTAGLLYPELFTQYLTDKDREAVANPAKFKDQKGNKKALAGEDYQKRMARIFAEQRRLLKANGIMTVMFTHKASGAWDALTRGLIEAGFRITASWPINTEAEGSLHIREKSAAKSTIFLVCRAHTPDTSGETRYWEDIEPLVQKSVRTRVAEFQTAGIAGIDLYLACFGPALEIFTSNWPLTRGRPRPQDPNQRRGQKKLDLEAADPYSVTPEDALDVARREVKQWRLDQLATVKRQQHIDAVTEWFILAWDTFRAPKFDIDEALKLARVIGVDFDKQIKNQLCETKGDTVTLWDSATRAAKHLLPELSLSTESMIDALHRAAFMGRQQNSDGAASLLEKFSLLNEGPFVAAFEALRNVLPPAREGMPIKSATPLGGAQEDFLSLEKLRQLVLADQIPAPVIPEQIGLFPAKTEEEDELAEE